MLQSRIINEKDVEIRFICDNCKIENDQIFRSRLREYLDLKKLNSVKDVTTICPNCNDSVYNHSIINGVNYKYNY